MCVLGTEKENIVRKPACLRVPHNVLGGVSPLVPVFSFGEPDVFRPPNNPQDSLLRKFQEKVRQLTGISPMFPIGRGVFQYSIGVVPLRSPVTTV
ncbi:jg885, partial [Pararge aegeria aegeria]